MESDEYLYLKGPWEGELRDFFSAAYRCLEKGWVDELCVTTPEGEKAMKDYEDQLV